MLIKKNQYRIFSALLIPVFLTLLTVCYTSEMKGLYSSSDYRDGLFYSISFDVFELSNELQNKTITASSEGELTYYRITNKGINHIAQDCQLTTINDYLVLMFFYTLFISIAITFSIRHKDIIVTQLKDGKK